MGHELTDASIETLACIFQRLAGKIRDAEHALLVERGACDAVRLGRDRAHGKLAGIEGEVAAAIEQMRDLAEKHAMPGEAVHDRLHALVRKLETVID